jgi:hypothetical protein
MSRANGEDLREIEEEKDDGNDRSRSRDEGPPDSATPYKGLSPEQLEHVSFPTRLVRVYRLI